MKRVYSFFFCAGILLSVTAFAQIPTDPDKSPMDMSYSPNAYPVLKFQSKQTDPKQLNARVIYSRPQVKGREIFGGEVKFGELWRMGANESTELDLYKNAIIGGKKMSKGRYTLYCIPQQDRWTIILNKDTDSWGGFSYNEALDIVRITVPVTKLDTPVEYLTMYFEKPSTLTVMWADAKVSIPIQFTTK